MRISIIAACYNVSGYIDRFFSSIVNQSIGFEENISVICIDDGSNDNTKLKILLWQKRYPNNIHYLYQTNSGQAIARNTGISYITESDWVIFSDPDDSFSLNFFEEMLGRTRDKEICIVCSRTVFYLEDRDKYSDSHPLRYRFYGLHKEKVCNLNKRIIPAANSSLFRFNIIKRYKILFDEKVKPTFEDTLFVINYLHYCNNSYVYFSAKAKYFYTKRSTRNSTIDLSKKDPRRYYDQLLYGNLVALSKYSGDGGYVKTTVLYDILWLFKYIIDRDDRIDFLTDKQIRLFKKLLAKIFSFYSISDIETFDIVNVPIQVKLGICYSFLNDDHRDPTAIIDEFDFYKSEVKIHFFTPVSKNCFRLVSKGISYEPLNFKTVKHRLGRSAFLLETVAWFSVPEKSSFFIFVNEKQASLIWRHKCFLSLKHADLNDGMGIDLQVDRPWLFIDRDKCADDNAEHFYRWVFRNTTKNNIYFVLRRESSDWNRLSFEGFHLIEYGSFEHKHLLKNSSLIISSQIDSYVYKINGINYLSSQKVIFLQHGVIKDDLSKWINSKPRIDLMLTSTVEEYNSIIDKNSLYLLTTKEVKLTGLPRFESLNKLSLLQRSEKIILIMPTWRKGLLENKLIDDKMAEHFLSSDFYNKWLEVLKSKSMIDFVNLGYKIIFRMHPCLEVVKDRMKLPSYVSLLDSQSGETIQELFVKSEFLITDYSSVAFDFASMDKIVFYYQFDKDCFFNNHTYFKGYFDYETSGFGPVSYVLIQLEGFLRQYLHNKTAFEDTYKSRMDGKVVCNNCCAKLYSELIKLTTFNRRYGLNGCKKVNLVVKNKKYCTMDALFRPYFSRGEGYLKIERCILKLFCTDKMFNKYKSNRIAFFSDSKSRLLNLYTFMLSWCVQLIFKLKQ